MIGITVEIDICEYDEVNGETFEGNLDILVKIEDIGEDNITEINSRYKEEYPFYENIDYLQSIPSGWASFSGQYIDEESWGPADYVCGMKFGDNTLVDEVKVIKVVYFDDEGNTLFMSDEVIVPTVLFYQSRDSLLYLETETNTLHSYLEPRTNPYLLLTVILVLGLVIYSIIIELVVALVFKLKSKKALLNIFAINLVTQLVMYGYFAVFFNRTYGNYTMQLLIYEVIVIIVEYLYLKWRLKSHYSTKRLLLYAVISNVISYGLGIMRYY